MSVVIINKKNDCRWYENICCITKPKMCEGLTCFGRGKIKDVNRNI